jgi:hypothetical protein
MAISATNVSKLNRMNTTANQVGLGTLFGNQSHYVVAAGTHTSAGGDATESITVSGALSTDIAIVTLKTAGATPRTITTAAAGSGAITVVLSGDPSTDHVISYMLLRAFA